MPIERPIGLVVGGAANAAPASAMASEIMRTRVAFCMIAIPLLDLKNPPVGGTGYGAGIVPWLSGLFLPSTGHEPSPPPDAGAQ
jgi:hypothetical protein